MSLVQFTVSRLSGLSTSFQYYVRFAFAAVFFRFRLKIKCYVEDLSSSNACKDLK